MNMSTCTSANTASRGIGPIDSTCQARYKARHGVARSGLGGAKLALLEVADVFCGLQDDCSQQATVTAEAPIEPYTMRNSQMDFVGS